MSIGGKIVKGNHHRIKSLRHKTIDYKYRTLMERISLKTIENPTTGCLEYQGCRTRNGGYAVDWRIKKEQPELSSFVHRAIYVILYGPIPRELEISRSCKINYCINPDHFMALSHKQVIGRSIRFSKGTCTRGHEKTEKTWRTVSGKNGERHRCWVCFKAKHKEYRRRCRSQRFS